MSDELDASLDGQVDKAMEILGDIEEDSKAAPDVATEGETIEDTGAEELTEEVKPNPEDVVEPETALEPPTSWRSDEKELFKNLPREAQEVALRLQQAQDSHFTQRSTELAQANRQAESLCQQYQADIARYAQSLAQLDQMAAELLPAKFSDIKSEADYLRLKTSDPARASEYEAFQQILQGAKREKERVGKLQFNEHLNREWNTFVEKNPEFTDETKARTMMDGIRKGAVEYYGYTPQEAQVIVDHRQIPVLRDALAWKQYQANLKAVSVKKSVPTQQRIIKSNGQGASNDGKAALLNRARKADKMDSKVDFITKYLETA